MSAPRVNPHAGVVTRILAGVADTGVVVLVAVLLYLGLSGTVFLWSPLSFTWLRPSTPLTVVVMGLVATGYLTAAWVMTGRTYGAALLGLRVLAARGGKLGWARATVRALTCVVFPAGLLWSAVSPTRRSLQDVLVGSVVVYDEHRDGGVRAGAATAPGAGTGP